MRAIAAKHINQGALDQRADLEKLNVSLRSSLESKGMIFREVNKAAFRDKLQKAGFFKDWKAKYGPEAWAVLEKYTGPMA